MALISCGLLIVISCLYNIFATDPTTQIGRIYGEQLVDALRYIGVIIIPQNV